MEAWGLFPLSTKLRHRRRVDFFFFDRYKQMLLKQLVREFRDGKFTKETLHRARTDGYSQFGLNRSGSSDVNPPLLTYLLPLDDAFLRRVADAVQRSPHAGKRLWKEWKPKDTSRIETKSVSDSNWASSDDLKPLNDVCTKWCVRTYFPDAFARARMVVNMIRLYDRLREVTDLRFRIVFKGGVMIRLLLLEFLRNLPLRAQRAAEEYLNQSNALGMSDLDFEIVADNHDSPAHRIHRFFALDYALLLWLQDNMAREVRRSGKGGGMLECDWDEEVEMAHLRDELQEAIQQLPATSPLAGARVECVFLGDKVHSPPRGFASKTGKPSPPPRQNVAIFACDSDTCVLPADTLFDQLEIPGIPCRSGGSRFYATLNTYVGEGVTPVRRGHLPGVFHLARIKHAFVVYYTTRDGERRCDRLGGEMIDLSQSHGTSVDLLRAALYANVTQPYATYPITGVDPNVAVMRSYSVEGFMYDHATMIHNTDKEPWEANKVQKRSLRCVCFLIAHTLGPYVEGTQTRKLDSLRALVERCRSTDAILVPLRTGIRPVDAFAARERAAAKRASEEGKTLRAYSSYLRIIHRHLATLVGVLPDADSWRRDVLFPRYLWHTEHQRHV